MGARMEKLRQWLSHPLTLLLGLVGTVASILSVVFYLQSMENRELTFLVNPVRTTVVKAGQTSRLKVSIEGRDLTNDITALQVAFWNAGKRPIRRGEILEPIVLSTGSGHPILEATLRKSSRQVTHIALGAAHVENGDLGVSWDILESADGGVLQLIYEGDPSVPLQIQGIVEGQRSIRVRTPPQKIPTSERSGPSVSRLKLSICLLGGVILANVLLLVLDKEQRHGISLALSCLVIMVVLFMIAIQIWQYNQTASPIPF